MAQLRPVFQTIANAIREKNGLTDTYTPEQMAPAILAISSGGSKNQQIDITSNGTYNAPEGVGYSPVVVNVPQDGALTPAELSITGDCNRRFAGWECIIKKYGNLITTKNISTAENMFYNCGTVTDIPCELNFSYDKYTHPSLEQMFYGCRRLQKFPKMINCQPKSIKRMFYGCENAVSLDDIASQIDFSFFESATAAYLTYESSLFSSCKRLRELPNAMISKNNPYSTYNENIYKDMCSQCFTLNKIVDLPNPHYMAQWDGNAFASSFNDLAHLKDLTFAATMSNGQPNTPKWSGQTISLTSYVGYCSIWDKLSAYGLPAEKEIKDANTYNKYKNDEDAWTASQAYSRYNHDSAVRTINSLPDASAYLASSSKTANSIVFAGDAGSATDGGAIKTLTESEIAVAAAKGWTVSF